jgi:hypothetical protein
MIHFVDDSEAIKINDDHWLSEVKSFNTNSASFSGYIEYQRTVTIPSTYEGRLRVITGMYPWDGITVGPTVQLDPRYVTDFNYNRYLVGQVTVQKPKTAPMSAGISNSAPDPGSTISYTMNYNAVPMDSSYRTFMHFIDDSGNIILNDDHWLSDMKSYTTSSTSFSGYVSYTRSVTLPSGQCGRLRLTTGFYPYVNGVAGNHVQLSTDYVSDIGDYRYLIGEINIPCPAPDLQVYQIGQQPGATGGQPGKIYVFVTNNGASYPYNFNVQLYVDGNYVTSTTVAGLSATEIKIPELTATVSAGQHLVTVYVEQPSNDKNPSNNQLSQYFTWAQPASQSKPAPKPASFSNATPAKGTTLTYTYNIQAYTMDYTYRSMVHFLNDSNNIVINDDHWLSDVKGFQTNSASFSGLIPTAGL